MSTSTAYIYLFPNERIIGSETQGIVENGLIYTNTGSQAFYEAPADWTIYIVLNIGNTNGYINILSSLVDYEDEDEALFSDEW